MLGSNPTFLREKLKIVSSLPIVCGCVRVDESVSQPFSTHFNVYIFSLIPCIGVPRLVFQFLSEGIAPCIAVDLMCPWEKMSSGSWFCHLLQFTNINIASLLFSSKYFKISYVISHLTEGLFRIAYFRRCWVLFYNSKESFCFIKQLTWLDSNGNLRLLDASSNPSSFFYLYWDFFLLSAVHMHNSGTSRDMNKIYTQNVGCSFSVYLLCRFSHHFLIVVVAPNSVFFFFFFQTLSSWPSR